MSEIKINEVHLSLVRTFSYDIQEISDKGPFNFLKDTKKYYEIMMTDNKRLSEQNIFVPGIGKFRSVLDVKEPIVEDPFFDHFKDYYKRLFEIKEQGLWERFADFIRGPSKIQLFLTPHYPCVIDIIPSKNRKYEILTSTLPGSLSTATEAKMSFSIRIYPAGLASLRLGWFFSTENNFNIEDIIEFLRNKRAEIVIKARAINKQPKPRYQKYSLDNLTKYYARRLKWGLLSKKTSQPGWEFSHSIIHIVKAEFISSQQNNWDILLPLLSLDKQPEEKERPIINLAKRSDEIYLAGNRSFVIYTPFAEKWERRKIRRWIRNIIEFFSIQKYLIREVQTLKLIDFIDELQNKNVINELRKGILPPNIKHLISVWNYLNIKYQPFPFERRWRSRYDEILKIWDENDDIKNSKEQTLSIMQNTVKEAENAQKKVGQLLNAIIENIDKVGKLIPTSN